jgi:hypothetical protein
MKKEEIDAEWEDFSLSDLPETKPQKKVYTSVLVVDLKGKKFEIEGNFSLSIEGTKIIAKAERSS